MTIDYMKKNLLYIFFLSFTWANAQGFSIELEGGTNLGINKFIYTNGVSPYFKQRFILGPSMGLSFNKFSKRKTAKSYISTYFSVYSNSITAILKKKESLSLLQSGNGGDPNIGVRWNYYGKNSQPYNAGIFLGLNLQYKLNRFNAFPKVTGYSIDGVLIKAIYLDNIIKFNGILPSIQVGVFKGLKLRDHTYIRFAVYGNIAFKTNSYWYYRAFIDNTTYSAVIKARGEFVNFSVYYGYLHQKHKNKKLPN